jgi:hypothetical protein
MTRCLATVAALCLFVTSASALTMEECRAKYKAEKAAGMASIAWVDYQKKRCGIDPKAAAPKPTSAVKH